MTENLRAEVLHPWHNVFGNLADSYLGINSLYHIGAVGSTIYLVKSGTDASVQRYFQKENPLGEDFGRAGIFLGWFWQITPAVTFYLTGLGIDDDELATGGAAGIQAIATTGAVTMGLKLLTGRKAPLKDGVYEQTGEGDFRRTANAENFKFFNTDFTRGEGRVFWPSGHTSSTFTYVSAMYAYYPDKHWIAIVGYPLSVAMGLSTIEHDSHWLSDVVAGALIGHVIGYTIGKNFRISYNKLKDDESANSKVGQNIDWQFTFWPNGSENGIRGGFLGSF